MVSFTFSPEKFENVVSVILRVPGYFILDYSYKHDLLNCIPKSLEWPDIVSSGFAIFGVLQGILVLLLPLEKLVSFYMHYLTIAVLAGADTFSHYYVETEKSLARKHPDYGAVNFPGFSDMLVLQKTLFLEGNEIATLFLKRQVSAIVFHTLGAICITFFLDLGATKEKILLLVYLVPVFARLAGSRVEDLHVIHTFSSCFVIFITVQYIFLCMPRIFKFIKSCYGTFWVMFNWYGAYGFFLNFGSRLFQPTQIVIFWLCLFGSQVYSHIVPNSGELYLNILSEYHHSAPSHLETTYAEFKSLLNGKDLPSLSDIKDSRSELISKLWHLIFIQSAAEVCFTPLMLLGLCVTTGFISNLIVKITYKFAAGSYYTTMPAVSHYTEVTVGLLAIQTSLLYLPLLSRVALLSIIFRIIISSVMQNMFDVIEPVILSVNARGFASIGRHIRSCITLILLCVTPIYMIYTLCLIFDRDIWLMIVASANALTSIQSIGLFITYAQLSYEAISKYPWPNVDDYIYYTRAVTRILEFIVALFLVYISIEEYFKENWSLMNGMVIALHTYFNIYQRFQLGWQTFLARREAVRKMQRLSVATQEQINEYDDVCAICFGDMTNAVVTKCKHIFHIDCLQRCLYVQDNCPMCHASFEPDPPPKVDTVDDFLEYHFGHTIPNVDSDED